MVRAPFLTPATTEVLPWVNATMVAGIAANVLYAMWDPRWLKALGDIVTTSIGIVSMVRIWQVFPLDFTGSSIDWALVSRVLLGVGFGGSGIAVIVALVTFVRALTGRE